MDTVKKKRKKTKYIEELGMIIDYIWEKNCAVWKMLKIINCQTKKVNWFLSVVILTIFFLVTYQLIDVKRYFTCIWIFLDKINEYVFYMHVLPEQTFFHMTNSLHHKYDWLAMYILVWTLCNPYKTQSNQL